MAQIYTLDVCINTMKTIATTFINNREKYEENLDNCINEIIPELIRPTYIKVFNSCNCCDHHKENKPSTYSKWIETPFNDNQEVVCTCPCRHYSRWICRTCKD
jgi:hypothetical protein